MYSRFDDSAFIKSNNEPWSGINYLVEDQIRDSIINGNRRLFENLVCIFNTKPEISVDVMALALQHRDSFYIHKIGNFNNLRWPNPKHLIISTKAIEKLFLYGFYICPAIIIKYMIDSDNIFNICRMLREEYSNVQTFIRIMKITVDQPEFYNKVFKTGLVVSPDIITALIEYAIEKHCYATADIVFRCRTYIAFQHQESDIRKRLETQIQTWIPEINHYLTDNTINIVKTLMTLRITESICNILPIELCFLLFSQLLNI